MTRKLRVRRMKECRQHTLSFDIPFVVPVTARTDAEIRALLERLKQPASPEEIARRQAIGARWRALQEAMEPIGTPVEDWIHEEHEEREEGYG